MVKHYLKNHCGHCLRHEIHEAINTIIAIITKASITRYIIINIFPNLLRLYIALTTIINTQAARCEEPIIIEHSADQNDTSSSLLLPFDESPNTIIIINVISGITNIHTAEIIHKIFAALLSSFDICGLFICGLLFCG